MADAASFDEIRALLQNSSYAPALVPPLESYLRSLMDAGGGDGRTYQFDAIRALVKCYQLFPGTYNAHNVECCCLLALAQYPRNDLLALHYMLPPSSSSSSAHTTDTTMAAIWELGRLLDAGNYVAFWPAYTKLSDEQAHLAPLAQSCIPVLQHNILRALAHLYQQAPTAVVRAAINHNGPTMDRLRQSPVVASMTDDTVVFVSTTDNTRREKVYQESVSFASIAGLMAQVVAKNE